MCARRPADILWRDDELFDTSGRFWGQTGLKRSAWRGSFHGDTVTGGIKRRFPTGGVANGMPKYVATG